jgi:hypothetical protein
MSSTGTGPPQRAGFQRQQLPVDCSSCGPPRWRQRESCITDAVVVSHGSHHGNGAMESERGQGKHTLPRDPGFIELPPRYFYPPGPPGYTPTDNGFIAYLPIYRGAKIKSKATHRKRAQALFGRLSTYSVGVEETRTALIGQGTE